jgi:hypothetical protein
MTLNRKNQPLVYKRIAIHTTLLEEEQRRVAAFWDIAIGVFGLAFAIFLFGMLG